VGAVILFHLSHALVHVALQLSRVAGGQRSDFIFHAIGDMVTAIVRRECCGVNSIRAALGKIGRISPLSRFSFAVAAFDY
jgi:hypothetical protein